MQMPQPQLKVVIDARGNVKMEVIGAQGPACLGLTRDLEVALTGGQETSVEREFKPEFHLAATAEEQTQQTTSHHQQSTGF